jgi:GTP-binding protein
VEFVLGAAGIHQFPEPLGWEAAFMGRSNSGKSSMLNRLLGRKAIARVSSEPGRTREINFFRVVWRKGGAPFYIADFPGYGYARAPKDKVRGWAGLAGGYLAGKRGQKSFLLADIRRTLGEDEFMLLDLFRKLGSPAVMVATKCDKLTRNQRRKKLAEWRAVLPQDVPLLEFSSLTGEGREELILEAMPPEPVPDAAQDEDLSSPDAGAAFADLAQDAAGDMPGIALGSDPSSQDSDPASPGPDGGEDAAGDLPDKSQGEDISSPERDEDKDAAGDLPDTDQDADPASPGRDKGEIDAGALADPDPASPDPDGGEDAYGAGAMPDEHLFSQDAGPVSPETPDGAGEGSSGNEADI